MGVAHPESRDQCVSVLTGQLEEYMENGPTVNAFVIYTLVELKAVESASVMAQAFDAGQVEGEAIRRLGGCSNTIRVARKTANSAGVLAVG